MTQHSVPHLTTDDLDALLKGTGSASARAHLTRCETCHTLAATDAAVVAALSALPLFAPRADLAEQVMAQVRLPKPSPVRSILRHTAFPSARAAILAVILLGGMTSSVVWSLANRELLTAWGNQAVSLLDGWLWLGLRTIAANVTAQPWYGAVRDALGSPARLGLAVTGVTVIYAAGILLLRRLVALPSRTAPHAV